MNDQILTRSLIELERQVTQQMAENDDLRAELTRKDSCIASLKATIVDLQQAVKSMEAR